MNPRILRRSAVLGATLTLLVSAAAVADTVGADGDRVQAGGQTFIDLEDLGYPDLTPGQVVDVEVDFVLRCSNGSHPNHGETIALGLSSAITQEDGSVTVVPGVIGPIPTTWPVDGVSCSGTPTLSSSTPAIVRITAPTTAADDYLFTVIFRRTESDGTTGTSGSTAISIQFDVVANTPPVLHLPDGIQVEGNTTGGWASSFDATAVDAEDDPDPDVDCSPASGTVFPLGPTTVDCSTVDSGGLGDSGSFVVRVVDTRAPVLSGVPGDRTVVTAEPGGAVVAFDTPTATDVVDDTPSVSCAPASGSTFAIGATTVTCTARDDSGNPASATFTVTVIQASALFEQPVGNGGTFSVSGSRTIPIKVQLFRDGLEVVDGEAWVWVAPCGGSAVRVAQLERQTGRWMGHLDTGAPAGCREVTIRAGGVTYGGFELRVDAAATAAASKPKTKG